MKKVLCLYRVSTKGQVDKQDDIPMQRGECRTFIDRMEDWIYYDERMEKGVSGYKVSANKRDVILEICTMIRNPIYTGRMHMNDILSDPKEELRLVSDETFDFCKRALKERIPFRYPQSRQKENEAVPPGCHQDFGVRGYTAERSSLL